MKNKLIYLFVFVFLFSLISVSGFSANTGSYQYTAPNLNSVYTSAEIDKYWPMLKEMENGNCEAGTDFLVMIPPGGCSPSVVRSDLLADQKVPVFCQLSAVKINPLIQVSSIKSISFQGEKPKGVLDISFHPARAAIRSYNTVLGSPLMNNIGYVVLILDRTKNESSMPDWISGNLTATMYYDIDKAYGTGKAEYFLPIVSEDEWNTEFKNSAFWNGKGFLRTEDIEGDKAKISVYLDKDQKYKTVDLKIGEQSNVFYFPFSYCKAGLQVKLERIETEEDKALLNIDGDQIWVRKGSKVLNDRCSINDLRILPDNSGTVDISCPQKKLSLYILPKGSKFDINGDFDVSIGQRINSNYSLIYSSILPELIKDKKGEAFAVVVKSSSSSDLGKLSQIISERIYSLSKNNLNQKYNSSQFKRDIESSYSGDIKVLFLNEKIEDFTFQARADDIPVVDLSSNNAGDIVEDYVTKSKEAVKELVDIYPSDKEDYSYTSFAEESLLDSIITAKKTGNMQLAIELGDLFIQRFPDSRYIFSVQNIVGSGRLFDLSLSQDRIFVNNEEHYISLDELKPLNKSEKKARIMISGVKNEEVYEGQIIYFKEGEENKESSDFIEIEKISVGEVTILYTHKTLIQSQPGNYTSQIEKRTLKEDESQEIFARSVAVQNIDVRKIAYVSLNPHIDNSKSTADFTFKIGIEQRNIKLSDEKTQEMIKNLNESIKKWEEINEKLGNLIKVWKGACFATSIVLMAKSTIAGFTGQGIARQKVMEAYRDECDSNLAYKGMSRTQCYNILSSQIDRDVDSLTNSIKTNNDLIKQFQSRCTASQGSLFSGAVVNEDCVKGEMRKAIKSKSGEMINVAMGDGRNVPVNISSIDDYDTLRMLLAEKDATLNGGITYNATNNDINARLKSVALIVQEDEARKKAGDSLGKVYSGTESTIGARITDLDVQTRQRALWSGDTLGKLSDKDKIKSAVCGISGSSSGGGTSPFTNLYASPPEDVSLSPDCIDDQTPVQFVQFGGNPYLLILQTSTSGSTDGIVYTAKYVLKKGTTGNYELLGDGTTLENPQRSQEQISVSQIKSNWAFYSGGSCSNTYSNAKVKYYDSGNAKGMPAIVPINLKEGWYAKVSQSPGGLFSTEQQGYKQSGQVSLFYLCNVGSDGLEKNGKWPDDICMSIDTNNYAKYTEFAGCPSMKGARFKKLIEDAQEAIRQAASQYGQKQVRILGQTINTGISVDGENLAECQDFMSPSDCKILFNVCDPVICPSSRCNLGGAYPVSNVIQSGIIGSLVLCLPNIKEGVMIPICLSGVYAGIESFVSILRSERECLQKSLDTGEHVGICDEITSIYLCEFFWRQLAPIMNLLIPKMIEMAYGQGTRGGGEYLSVQNSWDTLQKNIDYFKNEYAQNAFRAFQVRSVEEAGGEVCKAFIGTSLPTSVDALDSLLDPESPEQVTAWFSETLHSEATVPSTSHYKVYFHIFAGNDQGVQFRVYLKDPPSSSYYQSNQIINVKNGYLAKGGIADESIDFTSPSGYKELCVDINAQTKCGFKSVSTSFASEYITSKYVEQQAKKLAIKTEKECISGTPSVLSLVNTNLQSGAESLVNPSANLRGIVRICSTEKPGQTVDTKAISIYNETSLGRYVAAGSESSGSTSKSVNFNERWQLVGYCDNPNIGCWLDTESVKEEVEQVQAIETSLDSLEKQIANLDSQANKVTEETSISILTRIQKNLSDATWVDKFQGKLPLPVANVNPDSLISTVGEYIKETEDQLIQLGGGDGTEGITARASSNSDIAKARSLRVKLYNLVTLGLYKKYFPTNLQELSTNTLDTSDSRIGVISPVIGGTPSTSYIGDIKFYDSSNNDKTSDWTQNGVNNLISKVQFSIVNSNSECETLHCSLWRDYNRKISRTNSQLSCLNFLDIKSQIFRSVNAQNGCSGEFFIEAFCINNKDEVIESKNFSRVRFSLTNCPANSLV